MEEKLQCGQLDLICEKAKDPKKGFPLKDRRFGLRKYKNVLVGSEIVDWLYNNVSGMTTRKDAVNLAQELLKKSLFVPIAKNRIGKPFADGAVLYSFSGAFEASECDLEEGSMEEVKVSSDTLDDILPDFKDSTKGVPVKDRKTGFFKTQKECFVGNEAVDWLVNNFNISRSSANELGQKMINMGFFVNVNGNTNFEDKNNSFYRFVEDNEGDVNINENTTIFDFTVKDIDGNDVPLSKFKDKVCVVVNVASFWGLTDKNYTQFVELYSKYQSKGLEILAFPCNQFGNQEPGTNKEIKEFAAKYKATFPLFDKVKINGPETIPLYVYLKGKISGLLGIKGIKWNFTKFVCNRKGVPVERFGPPTEPNEMEPLIIKLLDEK